MERRKYLGRMTQDCYKTVTSSVIRVDESGGITKDEFDMAYCVLDELREKRMLAVPFMEKLCMRLSALF